MAGRRLEDRQNDETVHSQRRVGVPAYECARKIREDVNLVKVVEGQYSYRRRSSVPSAGCRVLASSEEKSAARSACGMKFDETQFCFCDGSVMMILIAGDSHAAHKLEFGVVRIGVEPDF